MRRSQSGGVRVVIRFEAGADVIVLKAQPWMADPQRLEERVRRAGASEPSDHGHEPPRAREHCSEEGLERLTVERRGESAVAGVTLRGPLDRSNEMEGRTSDDRNRGTMTYERGSCQEGECAKSIP